MVGNLSDEASILELLQAVSDDLACSLVVLGRADAVSLLATIVRLKGGDADLSSNVELVGNGGSSNVQPVAVVGSKVLVTSSLNVLGPLCAGQARVLTSGILILLPFFRCLEKASMNSLADTSLTVTELPALMVDS